jgi:NAD(P)-dependent dehydrogenase (short-subunit alcohol dehydrogenase family)
MEMKRLLNVVLAVGAAFYANSALAETVLITGSDRGIGFEFARQYADKGWTVIATTRSPDRAKELQALAKDHSNVVVERLDVTDLPGIKALAARYKDKPIGVLINNAGVLLNTDDQEIGGFNRDTFHQVIDVNTYGALAVTEAFLDNVKASGEKKVVSITSGAGSLTRAAGSFGMLFYKISKVSLNMAMQELKAEPKAKGVIFGMVAPGFVETPLATELRQSSLGRGRNIPQGITPAQSVSGMIQVISRLDPQNSRNVFDYNGSTLPY